MKFSHQIKHISLLLTFFILSSAVVNAKDNPVKFKITWPAGWDISSPKKMSSIKYKNSYLVRATKVENEKPKVILSIHEMPITNVKETFLNIMFDSNLKTQKKHYVKKGYDIQISEKETFKFKKFNALRSTQVIKIGELVMTQKIISVLTGKKGYSITSVIVGGSNEVIKKEIEDSINSLELF